MANQEIMQSSLLFTKKPNKYITDISSSLSTLHLRGGWGDPDVDMRDGTRGSNTDMLDYDSDDTMMSYPLDDVRGVMALEMKVTFWTMMKAQILICTVRIELWPGCVRSHGGRTKINRGSDRK